MYKRAVPTDIWRAACKKADVKYVSLYSATKRSGLTALSEAGLSMEDIRAMARHKDSSMTREYIVEDDQKRARAASALHKLIDGERKRLKGELPWTPLLATSRQRGLESQPCDFVI
jgi:hypothetical protein